jgi:S-disulfanyl-L-cysteine oxidoreductase SoxD
MNRRATALVGIAAAALTVAVNARARPQEPGRADAKSTMAGVYTLAQASRGETTYMNLCAGCHSARNYASQGFTLLWSGRKVVELFDYLRGAMPKTDPGSLTAAETTQVIADLLKINRVPAGKVALPATNAALQSIVLEFPPTGAVGVTPPTR